MSETLKFLLIGLGCGIFLALVVYFWQLSKRRTDKKKSETEVKKYKNMLADRMDLESDGISGLKIELEKLRKENENLRITNSNLLLKPGRKEVQRLQVYQTAIDRLVINSPGFGAAWQSALKESEAEFEQTYSGAKPFFKKILPHRTNPKLIDEDESND